MTTQRLRHSFNGGHSEQKRGMPSVFKGYRVASLFSWLVLWLAMFMAVPSSDIKPSFMNNKAAVQAATQYVQIEEMDVSKKITHAWDAMNKGDLNFLLNLSNFEVLALMGVPNFNRKDGNVNLWQYRHESCVIDIFLNDSQNKPGEAAVVFFSVRPRQNLEGVLPVAYDGSETGTSMDQDRACLNAVLKSRSR